MSYFPDLQLRHSQFGSFDCSFMAPKGSMMDIPVVDCNVDCVCVVDKYGVSRCPRLVKDYTVFYLMASLVAIFILYLLGRYLCQLEKIKLRPFRGEVVLVLSVLLTLFDFSTDCLFVKFLYDTPAKTFHLSLYMYLSIASLAVPAVLNIGFLVVTLNSSDLLEFWLYFKEKSLVCSIVLVLSCLNVSLFVLVASVLFGSKYLEAPLSGAVKSRIISGGLISNIFEDLPQLILQVLTTARLGKVNSVVLVSIVTSCFAFLLGVLKKRFTALMIHVVSSARLGCNASIEEGVGSEPSVSHHGRVSSQKEIADIFFNERGLVELDTIMDGGVDHLDEEFAEYNTGGYAMEEVQGQRILQAEHSREE